MNLSAERNKKEEIELFRRYKEIMRTNKIISNDTKGANNSFLEYMEVFFIVGFIPMIGVIGYLYMVTKENQRLEQVACLVLLLQYALVFSVIYVSQHTNRQTFEFLEMLTECKFGTPPTWQKTDYALEKWTSFTYYFMILICIVYQIFQYCNNSYCTGREIRGDHRYVCGSSNPQWFLIEIDSELIKLLLILCSLVVAIRYYGAFAVAPILILGSIVLIVLKVRHLKSMLTDLEKEYSNPRIAQKKLKICILYHASLVELVAKMNEAVGKSLLLIYAILPIMMALFGYQTIQTDDSMALLNLTPWLGNVSMICLLGQYLQTESSQLYGAAYDLPWYEMNLKSRKTFQLFLARVRKPLSIEVRYISNLGNILLLQILRTFYSYLMFLIQISMKNI